MPNNNQATVLRPTDAMLSAGGSAVLKTAHLTGCERAKVIYLAMEAARPEPQQDVVERIARIQRQVACGNGLRERTSGTFGMEVDLADLQALLQALQVPELPKWEGDSGK
jgi:hypothetical protein